ncbi:MAG: alpha-glucan family phosphorylase [Planctomycetes bacterium]|nr:alpha-glucan family phosphorylase [Planctomycetota bacterium]
MRPLRTFTVEPSLPERLQPLLVIAHNLWQSWHGDARDIFRRLDAEGWEEVYHNPVAMLGRIDQKRLIEAAEDEGFIAHLERVSSELQAYLDKPGWWQKTYGGDRTTQVAYFCAEYGISECLPIYSGGLGVLAGDHLKSASELDIPLVGVGLLYQQGYFRQRLNADGWQLELFPRNDFHNMPVELVRSEDGSPVKIQVDMCDHAAKAQIWLAHVGRISLYMLDTNIPENSPEDRQITAQLYGGDQEMRIRQEILLGIGGVRMLRALNIEPKVFHMNEGHSAFLGLERIRHLMEHQGISFDTAWEAVKASNVFTTHTPVPAGNDAFEPWLIEKYFSSYWEALGLDKQRFLGLGRQDPSNNEEPMNLTVLALRLSNFRNGVSKLHGSISRKLWSSIWPGVPVSEIPLTSITNGIHTRTWISHDLATLYDRYLGPRWQEKPADMSVWEAAQRIPDTEVWRTHERRRERLVAFARRRFHDQLVKRGAGTVELTHALEILDPEALTIGFARRFATYKRANMILSDPDRLARMLDAPGKRVQIIFAGKAHPRDNPGKDLIRQIIHICRKEPFRKSLMFLEDYDMNVARYLVQGVDVWLNTPLRPMEASGTSGMKVAANGGLNISILDGWWVEGYDPAVGWAIGSGETYDDLEYQNSVESQALYDLLEKEVIPLFYDRGQDNLPRGWVAKMQATMARLAPVFNTNRMVRQYAETFYAPCAKRWDELTTNNMSGAGELSDWKRRVREQFNSVRVESVTDDMKANEEATVGRLLTIEAIIDLAQLSADDIIVELYHGRLDEDGQLNEGQAACMEKVDQLDDHRAKYVTQMPCDSTGMAGYTVRIMPNHHMVSDPHDMGVIRWA